LLCDSNCNPTVQQKNTVFCGQNATEKADDEKADELIGGRLEGGRFTR
jgi:hypothetical protein